MNDLLRACILEQGGTSDGHLSLIEFSYNNSFDYSIGMMSFEELYGWRCRTPLCWYESGKSVVLGLEIVQQTTKNVKMIRDKMKITQSRQESYHDVRRKCFEFKEGGHVFLRVNRVTVIGHALKLKKLIPKLLVHIIFLIDLGLLLIEWSYHPIFQIYMTCYMYHNFESIFTIHLM